MGNRNRAKIGRRSRRKGAAFERWVANQLKAIGFTDARRQPQSQIKQLKAIAAVTPGFNPCLTDVVALPFGVECKHRKQLPSIESTLQQAKEDCGDSGAIPVAIHKGHGWREDEIVVGVHQFQLMSILKTNLQVTMHGGIVTFKWPIFKSYLQNYLAKNPKIQE